MVKIVDFPSPFPYNELTLSLLLSVVRIQMCIAFWSMLICPVCIAVKTVFNSAINLHT
jgi:hypothetical protein